MYFLCLLTIVIIDPLSDLMYVVSLKEFLFLFSTIIIFTLLWQIIILINFSNFNYFFFKKISSQKEGNTYILKYFGKWILLLSLSFFFNHAQQNNMMESTFSFLGEGKLICVIFLFLHFFILPAKRNMCLCLCLCLFAWDVRICLHI